MDPSIVIEALLTPDSGARIGAIIIILFWLLGRDNTDKPLRQRLAIRSKYLARQLARVVPVTAPIAASILIAEGLDAWPTAITTFLTATLMSAGILPEKSNDS